MIHYQAQKYNYKMVARKNHYIFVLLKKKERSGARAAQKNTEELHLK